MSNPYEAPQTVPAPPRRWMWPIIILLLWCVSAAIGGFLLGMLIYFGLPGFNALRQSPWWQVAMTFAIGGAVISLPLGLSRVRRLHTRLTEIAERREALLAEMRARGKS